MHTRRSAVLLLLVTAAIFTVVGPAAASPLAKGTIEFSPTLSFNRSTMTPQGGGDAVSLTHVNFNGSLSACVNEKWQLTGGLLFQHRAMANEGQNGIGGSLGATYNFNYPERSGVMPFMSVAVGAIQFSRDGETDKALLLPMLRLGVRTMMWEGHAISVSAGYQHETNNQSAFEESANLFDVGVGMSFFKQK